MTLSNAVKLILKLNKNFKKKKHCWWGNPSFLAKTRTYHVLMMGYLEEECLD